MPGKKASTSVQQHGIEWTNRSVRQLAGNEDPVAVMERLARAKVLAALDAGWDGPPFNPLDLADMLKIPVEANAAIPDARTVPHGSYVKIEFNPTQPRERTRFSIAHEVAHTLFPDVNEAIRNRGGRPENDDWQVEMLCNLGAAEFIMPIGSLPISDRLPGLEMLMSERRRFDVSAEAFLIRAAKVAAEPVLMFCASPIETSNGIRYRIDYVVPSRGSSSSSIAGRVLRKESVVTACTAIGFTARANDEVPGLGPVHIECVGIPGYPGSSLPRVAGFMRTAVTETSALAIQYMHGDALRPRSKSPRVICQLVNDTARRWGGGIARQAARRYPKAHDSFAKWIGGLPKQHRLGSVHFSEVGDGDVLASLIAQEGFGASAHPRLRYVALEQCLNEVAA